MYEGNPMQFPHMMNMKFHQVWCGNIRHRRNEMRQFRKSIGDDIDGIEPVGFRQFTNEVRLDPLPWPIRGRDRLKLSVFPLIPMLRSPACMTTLYVSLDIVG
jgi:hypothetical protein